MFYEFKRKNGWRFLINFESGWGNHGAPKPGARLVVQRPAMPKHGLSRLDETIRERLIPSTKEV